MLQNVLRFKNTDATASQNPVSMHCCSDNMDNSPLPKEKEKDRTKEQSDSSGEQGQEEEATAEEEQKVHDNPPAGEAASSCSDRVKSAAMPEGIHHTEDPVPLRQI